MNLRVSAGPHFLARETTQTVMLDVIIAMAPAVAAGVYLFGLRAAWVLGISVAAAVLSEYLWQKLMKRPLRVSDLSAVVTGLLVGLNLPASAPLWLPVIGSTVAIILVKELFGGIGHNFMNPALFARAFLLASWPARMTVFTLPVRTLGTTSAPSSVDAITAATPLASPGKWGIYDLLMGNIPGSIGEVCKIAILIGFVYLLIVKTITWHAPVVFLATASLATWLLGGDPLTSLLSGGLLFGAVFMATDYTTSPLLRRGRCIFALGCGIIVVIIRKYGSYPEGVTFAILLMNILTPLIDRFTSRRVYGVVKTHA